MCRTLLQNERSNVELTCWFYNQTWRCLSCTLSQASYKELGLLALVVIMGMLIFSGLTFVVEKDANPDEFISMPAALYWSIITMTSVGYGDITPR